MSRSTPWHTGLVLLSSSCAFGADGLLNHREFVVMLVCLCMIGLFGIVLDGYLAHRDNYVANNTSLGHGIPVQDLDVEEYNQLYDEKAFIYDKSRNRWVGSTTAGSFGAGRSGRRLNSASSEQEELACWPGLHCLTSLRVSVEKRE
eukprot:s1547_g21.t1